MSSFERTPEALDQHFSLASHRMGVHKSEVVGVGLSNRQLGDVEFDPLRHSPFDVNHRSILGLIDGNDYVTQVHKSLPVDVHVIGDSTVRHEMPEVTALKRQTIARLAGELDGSLSSVTDKFLAFEVYTSELADHADNEGKIRVWDRSGLHEIVESGAALGITFVLSDFHDIDFEEGSLEDVIAIKVNHLLERRIPQGLGVIGLGGAQPDLDTDHRKKLDKQNQKLDLEHEETVKYLENAGALVVPVIVDPRIDANGYDLPETDRLIAEAIEELNGF